MDIESHSSLNEAEIDTKEEQLKTQGYRLAQNRNNLHPYEYFRNEWSGSVNTFYGSKKFEITWCRPNAT